MGQAGVAFPGSKGLSSYNGRTKNKADQAADSWKGLEKRMILNHVHLSVRDLDLTVRWIKEVWRDCGEVRRKAFIPA